MRQKPAAVHISDLVTLYIIILNKILQEESIPIGEKGYYFVMAHRSPWYKVLEGIAKVLYSRGLVDSPEPKVWPSYEEGADQLGFPRQFIRAIMAST